MVDLAPKQIMYMISNVFNRRPLDIHT